MYTSAKQYLYIVPMLDRLLPSPKRIQCYPQSPTNPDPGPYSTLSQSLRTRRVLVGNWQIWGTRKTAGESERSKLRSSCQRQISLIARRAFRKGEVSGACLTTESASSLQYGDKGVSSLPSVEGRLQERFINGARKANILNQSRNFANVI